MPSPAPAGPRWIVGFKSDLICFGFGWLPAFALLLWFSMSEEGSSASAVLLVVILACNFLHRHATFPLVYGDPELFQQRRHSYRWLPIVFLLVTGASLSYVQRPVLLGDPVGSTVEGARPELNLIKSGKLRVRYVLDRGDPIEQSIKLKRGRHDLEQLAARVDRELGDAIKVDAEANRLRLTLVEGDAHGWIRVKGSATTLRAVGLEAKAKRFSRGSRPFFAALALLSVLWTIYHTLMQKLGLMRIYSRQVSGDSHVSDRGLLFSWFFVTVAHLAGSQEVRDQAAKMSRAGRMLRPALEAIDTLLPIVLAALFVTAVAFTVRFAWHEIKNLQTYGTVHVPKLLYVTSILGLYVALSIDLRAGYAAFGFSHAIEYLCFVAAFSARKYQRRPIDSSLMARWFHRSHRSIFIYTAFSLSIFFLARYGWRTQLNWYIVGSSFLHFIYDGWIWKVRKPTVQADLGIAEKRSASPA